MRKNLNTLTICGYVHSFGDANGRNKLEVKVTGAQSKNPGTEYIAGTINVATDEAGLNVIPVNFTYVTATYAKSGKSNPNFATLKKLIEGGKTWIKDGKDEADKVKIDGSIGLNEFYVEENGQERLVSTKVNEGSFINIVNELPAENERSTFKCDMLITDIKHKEGDAEKETPDYTEVCGVIFNFRNEILPLNFMVKNPQGMNYFESLDVDSEPLYTKVWGKVNCSTTTTESVEESAFGESSVRVFEKRVREWIITGTAKEAYEFGEEEVLTVADIQKAKGDREVALAEMRKRREEYAASKNTAPAAATTAAPAKAGKFTF